MRGAGDGVAGDAVTQEEYIAILFADNGYDTAAQRKAWLRKRFHVDFPDELDSRQKSLVITELKESRGSLLGGSE